MASQLEEALRKWGIDGIEGARSLIRLDLRKMGLTEIGSELGRLTKLQMLDLRNNQLRVLPSELGVLTGLQLLYLSGNPLLVLPSELGRLTNLRALVLDGNKLTALPPEIGALTNLQELYLGGNSLTVLPPEIGALTSLCTLDLRGNQLTALPPELGALTNLQSLVLDGNSLTALPPEIGALTNLETLYLGGNPLVSPPLEIANQGPDAIRAYFRGLREPVWLSKLLVVGEGGTGKTSLLNRLRDGSFNAHEDTTHGIKIDALPFAHPENVDVTMTLNAWDFGGQEIYHATHQFFLTSRSLFVLTWNARLGWEQGRLYYWLDMIQARAPQSPVLLVATHTDERPADLPLADIQRQYPNVRGSLSISSKANTGIEELRSAISSQAAALPLMGEEWPRTWHSAAEAIRALADKKTDPGTLTALMLEHGVAEDAVSVLRRWLHDLGDILYYEDVEELRDTVVLKPQWVTEYISKVLDSPEVQNANGLLNREVMRALWHDLDSDTRDFFLRLMEQFDLSYRTMHNQQISLIVERLSFDEPDYYDLWNGPVEHGDCRTISIEYDLSSVPAGVPTWFIARSHRYSTGTHWRLGAVFAHRDDKETLALVKCSPNEKRINLCVRGPLAHDFFAIMKDGLEVTLNRFPGLEGTRSIPCPGHGGQKCPHRFNYDHLVRATGRQPPKLEIECPESFEQVSIADLLFGIHWSTHNDVVQQIAQVLEDNNHKITGAVRDEVKDLTAVTQRQITQLAQSEIDGACPSVFIIRNGQRSRGQELFIGKALELQLFCEAPGEWHPADDQSVYTIDQPAEWFSQMGPHTKKLVDVLAVALPLITPMLGLEGLTTTAKDLKDSIDLMKELTKDLKDFGAAEKPMSLDELQKHVWRWRAIGYELRALQILLEKKDPSRHYGGLQKVVTKEGYVYWLCERHANEYRSMWPEQERESVIVQA